jgi:hypothetical protein
MSIFVVQNIEKPFLYTLSLFAKAKADSSKLCFDDLVRMNTDALALLAWYYV